MAGDGIIQRCSRCGDPDGAPHEGSEQGTAAERNCALYRIGTQLERLNDNLDTLLATLVANLPMIKWHING